MDLVGPRFKGEARDPLAGPAILGGGQERYNFEFSHGILGERNVAKVSGPLSSTSNQRPVELEFVARALAAIDGCVQHAGRTAA